jgi:aminoglycoside 2''-phosphotransferase
MNPDWRIVQREQNGLLVDSCRLIGEGWNSIVYVVNDELVFRFPKRDTCWIELRREIAFLEDVAEHLPVAVPRYLCVAPESLAAPHGYAVYRHVPGDALDVRRLPDAERERATDTLAAFLRALHTFTPSPDVAALLPREDARTEAEEYRRVAEEAVVPDLSVAQANALREQFDEYSVGIEGHRQPVVLHADLSREHIRASGCTVTGVIDFGDVNVGDPDYDFTYLYLDFGWEFVAATAHGYGCRDLERLRVKLRYFALVDQIDTIAHGADVALPGQERSAWQRLREMLEAKSGV